METLKRRLSRWLVRNLPPGLDWRPEGKLFLGGLALSAVLSLSYLFRFSYALSKLYRRNGTWRELRPGAVMPDFAEVLSWSLAGFLVTALCMFSLVAVHYLSHHRGSKSVYLMRRLPDRWERHRRCWTLPLLSAAVCALCGFVLLLLYYLIYMLATPEECLTPGQWGKLWRGRP